MIARLSLSTLLALPLALAACGESGAAEAGPAGTGPAFAQTLYVGHADGTIASYDLATGQQRPGELTGAFGPTDLQSLANGTLLVNLGTANQTLALDGRTMLEVTRVASGMGGARPVHGYLSPARAGRQYYLALNDGTAGQPGTNTAMLVDVAPESPTYLERVGEFALGVGHHKAAFSATRDRVVVSSIGDCADAISVFDYSDPADVRRIASFGATDLGVPEGACPATARPSPHGCATSKVSGKVYCNLTGTGAIAAIGVDEATPTVTLVPTGAGGRGGGYMKPSGDGRYVYAVQTSPREGQGGLPCQIGRLVVLHAEAGLHAAGEHVIREVPLLYQGCTGALAGDQIGAAADHLALPHGGTRLFVSVGGEPPAGATLAAREVLVLDVANPEQAFQLPSIPVGAHAGHRTQTVSGDGRSVFVVNGADDTVSQIDVASLAVVRTIAVRTGPRSLATFGTTEGPSQQIGPIH